MCENLYLNSTKYDLSMVALGGFYDHLVEDTLKLTDDQICTYMAAIG